MSQDTPNGIDSISPPFVAPVVIIEDLESYSVANIKNIQ
jgi:hypothetical protein